MLKIFLLGSERSGSNLLRTLLGNHSQISAPIAPHFCDVFIENFSNYPTNQDGVTDLLRDFKTYANHEFNDWKLENEVESIQKTYKLTSLVEFVNAFYSEKAIKEKKGGYFSKDNHNHKYALAFLKDFPDAKFVYLYRDPRDQIASWMRTPIHLHTPFQAAKKWKSEQHDCLKLRDVFRVNMVMIKYEDLVDNPEREMSRVLTELGLAIEPACFATRSDNAEAKKIPHWKNIDKPVMKNNYGNYKNVLSDEDINKIESICKSEMKKLGYAVTSAADWKMPNTTLFNLSEKIKIQMSMRKNKAFLEEKLKVLQDKHKLTNNMFSKFKK